jgi:hypothetical protein
MVKTGEGCYYQYIPNGKNSDLFHLVMPPRNENRYVKKFIRREK